MNEWREDCSEEGLEDTKMDRLKEFYYNESYRWDKIKGEMDIVGQLEQEVDMEQWVNRGSLRLAEHIHRHRHSPSSAWLSSHQLTHTLVYMCFGLFELKT